jgi:hypothetical protein
MVEEERIRMDDISSKVKEYMESQGYTHIAGQKGADFFKKQVDGFAVDIPIGHAKGLYLHTLAYVDECLIVHKAEAELDKRRAVLEGRLESYKTALTRANKLREGSHGELLATRDIEGLEQQLKELDEILAA